jgi:tetratricopeptide (TPR) repeat protein
MSGEFASAHLQRGMHLLRVRRYEEAEAAFKDALAGEPDDDFTLHQLAVSIWHQDHREKEALAAIQQAIRVAPNESEHHALKALIVGNTHSVDFAMGPANEAIRLDPTSTFAWFVRAQLYLSARKLPLAEADARKALSYDPDHNGAATVLSHALRMQGKVAENEGQIAGMLARDPEDDDNHAAAGWNALQAGQYDRAQTHFREALRLNPESEFARQGLIEAFKARSRIYRIYLRWNLWMASRSSSFQWGVVIGLYVLMRFSRALFQGKYAPVAAIVAVLYFIFVLWVHIARGLGNLMLLTDRFARHALTRGETREALAVGGCVVLAVLCGAIGAVLWGPIGSETGLMLLIFAGAMLAAAIPFAHTFTNSSKLGRVLFGGIGAFAVVAGILVLLLPWIEDQIPPRTVIELAFGAMIAAGLSTWLANFSGLRK